LFVKKFDVNQARWLIPVLLATQEEDEEDEV
jgi:hypothetical protein